MNVIVIIQTGDGTTTGVVGPFGDQASALEWIDAVQDGMIDAAFQLDTLLNPTATT